jgi:molybdopterin synthase catalytic subunit
MGVKNYFIEGPITPAFIADQIAKHNSKHDIGAHSIFLGQVRADEIKDKKVIAIEYSAYDEMANKKISEIREDAFSRWELSCLHIYHSKGFVKTGEISLFVFVSSAHRTDCIEAMQSIVEDIKHQVPIWKKEILEDETEQWVQE